MIQLIISFEETTGAVQVQGPLENKLLCYGMLTHAEHTIAAYTAPAVKPASLGDLGRLASIKGNGHG